MEEPRPPSRRWFLLVPILGVLCGLAALILVLSLQLVTGGALGLLAGHVPPDGGAPAVPAERPWLLPLLAGGGALLASLLTARYVPGVGGADSAIGSAHREPALIGARVPPVKTAATALTLGSGGSGGTEGPISQIGAALGSGLARRYRLTEDQARTLVFTGMGAGIAAIFKSPLGGAVIAAELPTRRGLTPRLLLPAVIATALAYTVFAAVKGWQPAFGARTAELELAVWPAAVAVGVACGVTGRFYLRGLESAVAVTAWLRVRGVPGWASACAGGLAVGALALAVPGVLGTGYGTAHLALDREATMTAALWMLAVFPLAKLVATALTVGTGGSGGVFGPGLVIGASLGCLLWRLALPYGLATPTPVPFVVMGMAAGIGPLVHAPIGVTLLAAEVTWSWNLLAPTGLAVLCATLIVRDRTLYPSQPKHRVGGSRCAQHSRPTSTPLSSISRASPSRIWTRWTAGLWPSACAECLATTTAGRTS
ncbi:chloride channel protein [Nonomuraea sp. NBC_01738]|nr:chloride channel protein [Nonomuraea sp. NBC_01738]